MPLLIKRYFFSNTITQVLEELVNAIPGIVVLMRLQVVITLKPLYQETAGGGW